MEIAAESSQNYQYVPRIDHLRFLAEGLVFSFHTFHHLYGQWQAFPHWPALGLITEGYTGVSLFFVLSGYLFMRIALQGGEIDYKQFIRNRFLRIFPVFVFMFFLAISIGQGKFQPQDILYLFFSNLGQAPTSNSFLTGAAWTISIEFTFYLVFPFLARFVNFYGSNYLARLIILLLICKIAAFTVSEQPVRFYYSTIIGRFDQFLIGMLAAVWAQKCAAWLAERATPLLFGAGLLVWTAIGLQAHFASFFLENTRQPFWIFWPTIEAALWALLIVAYVSCLWNYPAILERALRWGGAVSYSLYLLHGLVIYTVHYYLGFWTPGQPLWRLGLYVPFIAACAWGLASLSYITIERPFLRLRKKYLNRES
jgi:peptidoglycan/LPS O-acetylase OafA/YrhL